MLGQRFSGMTLVNYDSLADERRGCFSLVFRAQDLDGTSVAIKFFDPASATNTYRQNCFVRESQILASLAGHAQCIQLISDIQTIQLPIPISADSIIHVPCQFFAIEWINDSIDDYFEKQENYPAEEKLTVFSEIVYSVELLHAAQVFHRDLKPDNIRCRWVGTRHKALPIDLGTAARMESLQMYPLYATSAGAPFYAAPEALVGLAGDRSIAKYTDYYALGCMLFELFNADYHMHALLRQNPTLHVLFGAVRAGMNGTQDQQRAQWLAGIDKFSSSFQCADVAALGTSLPAGLNGLIDEVVCGLTQVDYRRRMPLPMVRRRIASAIRSMKNQREYQHRLQVSKENRRRRLEKMARQEAKFRGGIAAARSIS
jgi:serine/threonine protein kinase